MDINLLHTIIKDLETASPRFAKKMNQLLVSYQESRNETKKRKIEKMIRDTLYGFFVKSLTKESRYDIYDLGIAIGEECFGIEYHAANHWHVGYSGAVRVAKQDGEVVVKNYIPRDYKKGYYLETPENMYIVDKAKEIEFFTEFAGTLERVSEWMDKRQEVISGGYQLKSKKVSRELAENMITFLGLPRVDSYEELKRDTRQKVKC